MSYIKLQDAKNAIMTCITEQTVSKYATSAECRAARHGADIALFALDDLPTADVVEVRHGEWQYEQLDEYAFYKVTCPYCGAYYMGNYDAYHDPDDFNYCPNCGAKMDGERKEK